MYQVFFSDPFINSDDVFKRCYSRKGTDGLVLTGFRKQRAKPCFEKAIRLGNTTAVCSVSVSGAFFVTVGEQLGAVSSHVSARHYCQVLYPHIPPHVPVHAPHGMCRIANFGEFPGKSPAKLPKPNA